ncbi:MAG: riboflavin synthase [Myxococcota bacterium]|nr:riboflavin synthase [Myxococcota bacterium]
MFTGLIETIGRVKRITRQEGACKLEVQTDSALPKSLSLGESVAVDGVCLTVTAWDADAFQVDVSPETLSMTTIGQYKKGRSVNVERALRVGDRLGGHFVTGHVDGPGTIARYHDIGSTRLMTLNASEALMELVVLKGSITIDGISLTVNRCDDASFDVVLVPHTQGEVTLSKKNIGDVVNLETDLIGKYVRRLLHGRGTSHYGGPHTLTLDFLKQTGFAK